MTRIVRFGKVSQDTEAPQYICCNIWQPVTANIMFAVQLYQSFNQTSNLIIVLLVIHCSRTHVNTNCPPPPRPAVEQL